MYSKDFDEFVVHTVQVLDLIANQVQLPKDDSVTDQHQRDNANKAESEATPNIKTMQKPDICNRMLQPWSEPPNEIAPCHRSPMTQAPKRLAPHVDKLTVRALSS